MDSYAMAMAYIQVRVPNHCLLEAGPMSGITLLNNQIAAVLYHVNGNKKNHKPEQPLPRRFFSFYIYYHWIYQNIIVNILLNRIDRIVGFYTDHLKFQFGAES